MQQQWKQTRNLYGICKPSHVYSRILRIASFHQIMQAQIFLLKLTMGAAAHHYIMQHQVLASTNLVAVGPRSVKGLYAITVATMSFLWHANHLLLTFGFTVETKCKREKPLFE
jgi:hypothetical protein